MDGQISYRKLSNRRFGVEIEINNTVSRNLVKKVIENYSHHRIVSSNYRQSINNNYWHIKSDTSCGLAEKGRGWEVASFVGSGYDDLLHIGAIADKLKESGASTNKNCGFHVHVEVNDFEEATMGILLGYWVKIEWFILNIVSPFRDTGYCKELKNIVISYYGKKYANKVIEPISLWKLFKPETESIYDSWYRWRAINLVNYNRALSKPDFKRKTIEFRIPEGTIESDDIINWVCLFVNFVDTVKSRMPFWSLYEVPFQDAFSFLGLYHDYKNFYIFSEELHKTRIWVLNRIIWHNKLKNNNVFVTNDAIACHLMATQANDFLNKITI